MTDEEVLKTREHNRELCKKYPFLIPSNRWSGKRITDCAAGEKGYWPGAPDDIPEYDYEFTELDDMPEGWRIAFGDQLLEELKDELVKANYLNDYRITQIKEKYGMLRIYDAGCTEKWYREILPKYVELSKHTCILCGEPAQWISRGWISPYCDKCAREISEENKYHTGEYTNYFVPIDEYYSDDEGTD